MILQKNSEKIDKNEERIDAIEAQMGTQSGAGKSRRKTKKLKEN